MVPFARATLNLSVSYLLDFDEEKDGRRRLKKEHCLESREFTQTEALQMDAGLLRSSQF